MHLSTGVKRKCGGVSTPHLLSLLSRLATFGFMAFMSLVCGLLMLISAREGKSGWAWFWAFVFVITSVLTDMHFWGDG